MILKDKVAVIYGAGGAIGGAVSRALANEGARVFLTGRRQAPLEAVAADINAHGGVAHAAEVDALDENAIVDHLDRAIEAAGRIDISFNAIGIPPKDILGSLLDIDVAKFSRSITEYTTSYFLTARSAARRMIPAKSGVIIGISALPGKIPTPANGGYGAASAAKDQLTRDLSLELAPHGIRVVGLRPHAIPESATMREIYELRASALGVTWEQFTEALAKTAHTRRVSNLDDLAAAAVFVASDKASGLTGTTINLTMGGASD